MITALPVLEVNLSIQQRITSYFNLFVLLIYVGLSYIVLSETREMLVRLYRTLCFSCLDILLLSLPWLVLSLTINQKANTHTLNALSTCSIPPSFKTYHVTRCKFFFGVLPMRAIQTGLIFLRDD